jgi:hypothetical protein
MIYLLPRTINVLKSHRQPQWTLKLVCQDRVIWVGVVLHVCLCGKQHPECEPSIWSRVSTSYLNFALHPTPKTNISGSYVRRFKQLCPGIHSELHTYSNWIFFLAEPCTVTSKIIDFSWITLYVLHHYVLYVSPIYPISSASTGCAAR